MNTKKSPDVEILFLIFLTIEKLENNFLFFLRMQKENLT